MDYWKGEGLDDIDVPEASQWKQSASRFARDVNRSIGREDQSISGDESPRESGEKRTGELSPNILAKSKLQEKTEGDSGDKTAMVILTLAGVAFLVVLMLAGKFFEAMVLSADPVSGDLVIRTRFFNYFIPLLVGGLFLVSITALPGMGLKDLIVKRWNSRYNTGPPVFPASPSRWLTHGIPVIFSAGLFFAAVYVLSFWINAQTEIRISQADETVSVRQIHWWHEDDVTVFSFSDILDIKYSEYEDDEGVKTGSVALKLKDGREIPVMDAGFVSNAKSLLNELNRLLR